MHWGFNWSLHYSKWLIWLPPPPPPHLSSPSISIVFDFTLEWNSRKVSAKKSDALLSSPALNLILISLETCKKFLMNSFSFQETRRNPQTARKVTFPLTFLSQRPFLEQEGSFSSALFNYPKSEIICNLAKESKFIQGMAKGTLDPNVYGGYMV